MFAAVGQPLLSLVILVTPPYPPDCMEMLTLMLLPPPGWLKLVTRLAHSLMAASTTPRARLALAPKTAPKLSDAWPRLVQVMVEGTVRSSNGSRKSRPEGRERGRWRREARS